MSCRRRWTSAWQRPARAADQWAEPREHRSGHPGHIPPKERAVLAVVRAPHPMRLHWRLLRRDLAEICPQLLAGTRKLGLLSGLQRRRAHGHYVDPAQLAELMEREHEPAGLQRPASSMPVDAEARRRRIVPGRHLVGHARQRPKLCRPRTASQRPPALRSCRCPRHDAGTSLPSRHLTEHGMPIQQCSRCTSVTAPPWPRIGGRSQDAPASPIGAHAMGIFCVPTDVCARLSAAAAMSFNAGRMCGPTIRSTAVPLRGVPGPGPSPCWLSHTSSRRCRCLCFLAESL